MRKLLALVIAAASCLPACSEPRVDTGSLRTSMGEVAGRLSERDAQRFRAAMELIASLAQWEANPVWFGRALAPGAKTPPSPPTNRLMARVHGLTGKEVIALADELAAETQRRHGLTAVDVIALAHKVT